VILYLSLEIYPDRFFFRWRSYPLPMFTLDEALHICNANRGPIHDYRKVYRDAEEDTD
jgi:hypothetical protein